MFKGKGKERNKRVFHIVGKIAENGKGISRGKKRKFREGERGLNQKGK